MSWFFVNICGLVAMVIFSGTKFSYITRLKHNIGLILKSSVLCSILTYFHWI